MQGVFQRFATGSDAGSARQINKLQSTLDCRCLSSSFDLSQLFRTLTLAMKTAVYIVKANPRQQVRGWENKEKERTRLGPQVRCSGEEEYRSRQRWRISEIYSNDDARNWYAIPQTRRMIHVMSSSYSKASVRPNSSPLWLQASLMQQLIK